MVWSSERIESTSAGAYRRCFVGSWADGSKGKVGYFLGGVPEIYTNIIPLIYDGWYNGCIGAVWGKCPFKWGNRCFIFNHNQAFWGWFSLNMILGGGWTITGFCDVFIRAALILNQILIWVCAETFEIRHVPPTWSLTVRPWKVTFPKSESLPVPSFFIGKLAVKKLQGVDVWGDFPSISKLFLSLSRRFPWGILVILVEKTAQKTILGAYFGCRAWVSL